MIRCSRSVLVVTGLLVVVVGLLSTSAQAAVKPKDHRLLLGDRFVNCAPTTVGVATTCVAGSGDPRGRTATGTVTFSSATGTFAKATCTLYSGSANYLTGRLCTVQYTPSASPAAPRTDRVYASYSGDKKFRPISGWGDAAVAAAPTRGTAVSQAIYQGCENQLQAQVSQTCSLEVRPESTFDPQLTGTATVTITGTGPTVTSTCTLQPVGSGYNVAGCTMDWKPESSGTATITIAYSGDAYYAPQTHTEQDYVEPLNAALTLGCTLGTANTPVSCTVTGKAGPVGYPVPTGTASFDIFVTSMGGGRQVSGTFTPSSCTLKVTGNTSSCTVTFVSKDTVAEYIPLRATLAASSVYPTSYAYYSLPMNQPVVANS